jgi:hypothetical protein
MLSSVWNEIDYHSDVYRITNGAYIELSGSLNYDSSYLCLTNFVVVHSLLFKYIFTSVKIIHSQPVYRLSGIFINTAHTVSFLSASVLLCIVFISLETGKFRIGCLD